MSKPISIWRYHGAGCTSWESHALHTDRPQEEYLALPAGEFKEAVDFEEAKQLVTEIMHERKGRNVGGADDCYTDSARSREREWKATENLILVLATKWGVL